MFLFQIKVSHALVRFEKLNILGFYDIDSLRGGIFCITMLSLQITCLR